MLRKLINNNFTQNLNPQTPKHLYKEEFSKIFLYIYSEALKTIKCRSS